MQRSGILCGGAWCVDKIMMVDHWPAEETVAVIKSEKIFGGCPGHNMSTALKRLGAPFPVEGMGLLGDDPEGGYLLNICREMGISTAALEVREGIATPVTLVMSSLANRKRTFFTVPGAHALQTPDDFDFTTTRARIAHLGLPGFHEKLDTKWGEDVSGWVTVLKKARREGIKSNFEMASIAPERLRAAMIPILPWLDSLVINDWEVGALAEVDTVAGGVANVEACRKSAEKLMAMSSLEFIVVHFPLGAIALSRNGEVTEQSSVNVPQSVIVGNNGAGDSFAAGILFGRHEGWPMQQSLRLAHASAACSLRSETTTGAVLPWEQCLAQADSWGWR
jgi:sugar/nucleoside kinase (ribokinase family)